MSGTGAGGPAPVLVLRALALGDALAAVPALRGLRRAFPARPLLLAATGPPAELLLAHGLVDDLVPTTDLDAPPPGRGLGEHLAVNLHGKGPQSHRLLLAGAPSDVLAFDCPSAGVRGPVWDDDEHEVHRWCRLVRSIGGWCEPADLRLGSGAGPRTGPVVVHPGASTEARRWPARRFAALARALAARGQPVVVTGSPSEGALCARIVAGADLDAGADLAGRLRLDDLADLVRCSRLVICGDTGVAHLATALGTPSVLLFGPTPPRHWGPAVDPWRHWVLWHGPGAPRPPRGRHLVAPDPQLLRPDPALLRITVDEVLDAALAQLERAPLQV